MKRATISDVASDAGVSRTTVSLVLRDSDKIPGRTKQRVRESMARLGYVYNRAGAAVRVGRSSLLGLLLTDVRNPFFAEVVMAVDRVVAEREMSVLQSFSFSDPVHEARTARSLAEHVLGGLILLPTPSSAAEPLRFLAAAQPLVQLLRSVPGLESDFVGVDNVASGALLGTHLAEQGYVEVVLVGDTESQQLADRSRGLSSAGITVATITSGVPGLAKWLERSGPPDGVVTYNDTHLLEVFECLRRTGRQPGIEVGIASFDNTLVASLLAPGVTSVDHHVQQLAELAVRLLLERMDAPELPLRDELVKPTLVVRESTPERSRPSRRR